VYRLEGKKATVQANPRPHSYYQISVRADRRSRAVEIGRTASGRNCTGSDPSHDRHVPWAVACGADTVRARRITRGRSRCIACTPEVARPYGILGIMPFVRSPRTPGIPYLRLLLFVQKCHAKVSALELRFLVDQGARREFTQFLPQTIHQILPETVQFQHGSELQKKEVFQRGFCFHLFHTVYKFLDFFPSRFQEYNPIRSLKRTQSEPGRRLATVHARSGQVDPGCRLSVGIILL